jgi:mannosyl-3-phosphoglycerate phosphatase
MTGFEWQCDGMPPAQPSCRAAYGGLGEAQVIMRRFVFFTDLDHCLPTQGGSLTDHGRSALDALKSFQIPVVLLSGKTRAEIEPLRERLRHTDPFIVENGAAVFVPPQTFDFPLERSRRRASYDVIELGTPYAMLRDVLKQIEDAVNTPLHGFGDLSLDDIMRATGLSRQEALRAKLREYDEPFLMDGPASLLEEVRRQIAARGLRCTRGERFFHLTGGNDASRAADILLRCYRRKWQSLDRAADVETVVIGDSMSHLPLRANADRLVLLQKPDGSYDMDGDRPDCIRAPGIECA